VQNVNNKHKQNRLLSECLITTNARLHVFKLVYILLNNVILSQ